MGNADSADNLYSSVVAATRKQDGDSIITINGGTYNALENDLGQYKFSSRIFTPYKGNDNYDFGTIIVNGGQFNGNYNNPELVDIKSYLYINGGSFDSDTFIDTNGNIIKLEDMIDTTKYYIYTSVGPFYNVTLIPQNDYSVVNTSVK